MPLKYQTDSGMKLACAESEFVFKFKRGCTKLVKWPEEIQGSGQNNETETTINMAAKRRKTIEALSRQ